VCCARGRERAPRAMLLPVLVSVHRATTGGRRGGAAPEGGERGLPTPCRRRGAGQRQRRRWPGRCAGGGEGQVAAPERVREREKRERVGEVR
jgi:hypothetical protein